MYRSRRSLGNKIQVGPELIRPNQVVNPMKGLWRREWGGERERDGDRVKFVQLCVDVSTWSMVAILGLERIQVKGEIARIMT